MAAGVDLSLEECCEPDIRGLAVQEAPAALGWARWREIEEQYFLGLVAAALDGLAQDGYIDIPQATSRQGWCSPPWPKRDWLWLRHPDQERNDDASAHS